jgi:hypothetical protein
VLRRANRAAGADLPKKKQVQTEKAETLFPDSFPRQVTEEPGELQEFVDNYLTLADKALGFMRRPGPNNQLTISTCVHCQHTIAATDLKLLAFAENLHVCPAKCEHAPVHRDEVA